MISISSFCSICISKDRFISANVNEKNVFFENIPVRKGLRRFSEDK